MTASIFLNVSHDIRAKKDKTAKGQTKHSKNILYAYNCQKEDGGVKKSHLMSKGMTCQVYS